VREKIGEIAAGQARGLRSISSDKAVISSLHEAIRARSCATSRHPHHEPSVTPTSSPTVCFKWPHSTHICQVPTRMHVSRRALLAAVWLQESTMGERSWYLLPGDPYHVEIAILRSHQVPPGFASKSNASRLALLSACSSLLGRAPPRAVPSIASPKFTRASFSATEVYSGVRNRFIAPVRRIHPTLKSKRVLVIRHTFSFSAPCASIRHFTLFLPS
jgi:hypothetical protein